MKKSRECGFNIPIQKLIGLLTDGAPSMPGRNCDFPSLITSTKMREKQNKKTTGHDLSTTACYTNKIRVPDPCYSCCIPTAAAPVQSRVWSSGICGEQSGVGAGFLRVLRFPLPFIPPISPSSQSPGAGTIGQ
jgi:hypothetical protein